MKIGFIGCVESSYKALETLLSLKSEGIEVVAVVTKPKSAVNSDFVDLTPLCQENAIPFHYEVLKDRQDSLTFLAQYKPDVIYCFGWSYLLDNEMLQLAPHGAIGYHPAPLPKARGRHPIIWALALGLDKTASTFFLMDEGADSGAILSQQVVTIKPEDDARSLYDKLLIIASDQILDFSKALANGEAVFHPQDDSQATYWRKRSRKDGLIDWRMQANSIHSLVRALVPPYPGAECIYDETPHVVIKTSLVEKDFSKLIEPGCILQVDDDRFLIKCGGSSALWVYEQRLAKIIKIGDYL